MVKLCDECLLKGKYVTATKHRGRMDCCDMHYHCTDMKDDGLDDIKTTTTKIEVKGIEVDSYVERLLKLGD